MINRQQRGAAERKARKNARWREQKAHEISRPDYNPIHDPEFQQGTAALVRAINFKMSPELGHRRPLHVPHHCGDRGAA
jgi:hypothetical protein